MTLQDTARHLGVSWDVVKEIQKEYLKARFSKPSLKGLKYLAIDEITIGSGRRCLTVVMDPATGAVVFVVDGRGTAAPVPFWKRLKQSGAEIKAVAIDMSPAYIGAVMEHLPRAAIVFDHFHVIKLFNDRLSDLRRRLYHEASTQLEKEVIKGTRWLPLKNPKNLNESRNEPQRLLKALEINRPLAVACCMKEDLRQPWSQKKEAAEDSLNDWILQALSSGISMLIKFAYTLAAHRSGIPAYYDYPISTGPLEATNNKIKTMKRQAYGFGDLEFFKLKIMAVHTTKYALVGWTEFTLHELYAGWVQEAADHIKQGHKSGTVDLDEVPVRRAQNINQRRRPAVVQIRLLTCFMHRHALSYRHDLSRHHGRTGSVRR